MKHTPVTIVASTNRKKSLTEDVAHYYADLLHKNGCASQVLKLTELPPDFTVSALYENRDSNPAFNKLRDRMEAAQKYVFIVPEYNGSFPGVFKAFIDGLRFPATFKDKKCALVGVSKGGQGGIAALSHLTDIFHYLKMHVYPRKPALANIRDSRIQTLLANERYVQLLEEQAAGVIHF
ncbi:MAG: NAD(P)H-dependent oxidoreductase [Bacteroidota bacterium]